MKIPRGHRVKASMGVKRTFEEIPMPDSQPEAKEGADGVIGGAPPNDKPSPTAGGERSAQASAPPKLRTGQRNPILAELVQGEDDLAGLVGYALYKLNKRDWLASFFKTHGRDPTEGEVESYVLGERTQRRLATYRRLAEDVIGRKSGSIEKAGGTATMIASAALQRVSALRGTSLRSSLPEAPAAATTHRPLSATATLIFWIAVLVVLAGAGYYYVNYSTLFLSH
jgi:hypothetical protein